MKFVWQISRPLQIVRVWVVNKWAICKNGYMGKYKSMYTYYKDMFMNIQRWSLEKSCSIILPHTSFLSKNTNSLLLLCFCWWYMCPNRNVRHTKHTYNLNKNQQEPMLFSTLQIFSTILLSDKSAQQRLNMNYRTNQTNAC